MQATADRLAERLRHGLARAPQTPRSAGLRLRGFVYFPCSTLAPGPSTGLAPIRLKNMPQAGPEWLPSSPASTRRGLDVPLQGVLSGVHTESDIDQSLEAFDGAIKAMLQEGVLHAD